MYRSSYKDIVFLEFIKMAYGQSIRARIRVIVEILIKLLHYDE